MKILVLSDKIEDIIYTNSISERFGDIDFVISCGDLPNYYLEFVVSSLNKPLFYVLGNHDNDKVYTENGLKSGLPEGCINIDGRLVLYKGVVLMGLEGSMHYSGGACQYSERQMALKAFKLRGQIFFNRLFLKRNINIIVTHAPPYKIHDQEDVCHRGFKIFLKLIEKYRPEFFLHGHVHTYNKSRNSITCAGATKVMNCYGYKVIEIKGIK